MLKIRYLTLGEYQTNCYIVNNEGSSECCVIDPGYTPETILHYLEELHLKVCAILLTHGHFDHVGGVKTIASETDCRVYLNDAEQQMPPMLTDGPLYYTNAMHGGDTITEAGMSFTVIGTPGHTPGSVCLRCEDILFSGDTLFCRSCGRTDLPGGDYGQMLQSLRKLRSIEDDLHVLPGHGMATTLSAEKQYNPYL